MGNCLPILALLVAGIVLACFVGVRKCGGLFELAVHVVDAILDDR